MRWRSVDSNLLMLREFDGELVVKNDVTGSTHLLDPLAAKVLRTLIAAPEGLTAAELGARLAEGIEEQADWSALIEPTLMEFQRLGLAERASSASPS